MASEMGLVTQLAFRAITEDQLLWGKYATPEAVLDFLEDESNFKSLSNQLKETMIKIGLCEATSPQSAFVKELYERLLKQDVECGKEKSRNDATVKRWLSGHTKSIKYKDDVMEVCFALELDLKLTNALLNVAGHPCLNVRDAKDATYLYCILNHRSLSDALKIMDAYNAYSAETENLSQTASITAHSGNTTLLMENQILGNSNWSSDEEFLNTFLLPNKTRFIGYASSAVKEYFSLKNELFVVVFLDASSKEKHLVDQRDYDRELGIAQEDIPVSMALRNALMNHIDDKSFLKPYADMLNNDMWNTEAVLTELWKLVNESDDLEKQIELSVLFNHVMKNEGFLKFVLKCIKEPNKESDVRIRRYSDSSLKDTVMKEFISDKSFTDFERDPSVIGNGMGTRKALITMYYVAYAYEYTTYIANLSYVSPRFSEFGFVEFMEELNSVLSKCRLTPLYPANSFDWLILRSIRHLEVSYVDDTSEPVEFFNTVISRSFKDEPEISD